MVLSTVQRHVTLVQIMVKVSVLMVRLNVRPALIHVKPKLEQVDTAVMVSSKRIMRTVMELVVALRHAHSHVLQIAQP